ncbi:hypoxanthine phosphoribosyltransferase [Chlorobium phaeobacteroides]|jgi:hypoxanthine phosphoribosyltransferase|uniref:Hypoxanthine phosphoribosyltransferase n=1 Tax=Chlorobium phaeobacteroides (strain DSM 266 / SMG 266 / 2430) TaxID=290317 RepID=A1BHQ6_CHLPD|nr:hypoxanthine phosphoribosyltransferase [Chlorobium phaeobacteroides]ABL65933.1 hypoxanthine phosphoribosyltransferase [Chlorobium phaeobacteroides DSM 266]MBV5327716.1 hypoxanthine phosphoribosyltransferase [Chlorobium sp.]
MNPNYNAVTEFISAERLHNRICELGCDISRDYAGIPTPLVIIGVLKGAFVVFADLVRAITIPCTIDFLHASSYGSKTVSSGTVTIRHKLSSIQNRHVLLVEDIIDSGLTMQRITDDLQQMHPASMKIFTLLDKPESRKHPVAIAYTGFVVPDKFIVGYGIDFNEQYRELPAIGIINP